MKAAPQLAHLLLIIVSCVALFACLANLGSGDRVEHYSSYATAFEEILGSLLGLGYVQKRDIFPGTVLATLPQQPPECVDLLWQGNAVCLGAYAVLHVDSWCNFHAAERSAVGNKATSIGQDVLYDVLPESQAKLRGIVHLQANHLLCSHFTTIHHHPFLTSPDQQHTR